MTWANISALCLSVFAIVFALRAYGWTAALLLFVLIMWLEVKLRKRS